MTKLDLAALRVLIVSARGHAGPTLRTVLIAAGVTRIVMMDDPRRALDMLCGERFHAVFVEGGTELDGVSFAQAARRNASLLNPMVPIFAVYGGPRLRDVERSRDDGVTDVICRPMSPKTVGDKLRNALSAPRPFIAAPEFFGPDRRAKEQLLRGEDRRKRAPKKTRIALELE
jgi:two-component system chemotaxis response regulator CheY